MAEPTLPLSVHIGSTPLDRLLFNCPASVKCAQLLQSVQSALPHAALSHLSTFHHDRIPLDADMAQYVQAHDAVIAHFRSGPQQPPAASAGAGGVRMVVASPSAFTPSSYGPPPPPPAHMMPHSAPFSPSHPPVPPPHFLMYGPPPHPSAYHPMLPSSAPSALQPQPSPASHMALPPAASSGAISMVEACQLATQSVKPALDRYRTAHAASSAAILQSDNHNSLHSATARTLLHSLKRHGAAAKQRSGKKRAFQRVSGDVEAETESEGVSDDESMGSASSWSAVDDDGDSEYTRAAQAAQLIASLSQSPGGKRTPSVKLEHDTQSGSRLIGSSSPTPSPVFDSASLLQNKQLKHASVLVLYQAKEEQRPLPSSSPSTPLSLAPSSPVSSIHSMVLSPVSSSSASSPGTPNAKSATTAPSRVASSFNPRNLTAAAIGVPPSSHATTFHAAQAAVAVAASAASSATSATAHFMPASVSPRHRIRLGIPVMRERRRRRRRTPLHVTAATATSLAMPATTSFSMATAIPAMPVAAPSPAKPVKPVMAAISFAPNSASAAYPQPQQQSTAAAQAQQIASPAKKHDDKRTYAGKVRVYHNVPVKGRGEWLYTHK